MEGGRKVEGGDRMKRGMKDGRRKEGYNEERRIEERKEEGSKEEGRRKEGGRKDGRQVGLSILEQGQ